ncbi:MAG: hypothetical protein Q3972_04545 [Corynebacterium sp.]|nr:hypothetical protein [Corynebacterium sp.]
MTTKLPPVTLGAPPQDWLENAPLPDALKGSATLDQNMGRQVFEEHGHLSEKERNGILIAEYHMTRDDAIRYHYMGLCLSNSSLSFIVAHYDLNRVEATEMVRFARKLEGSWQRPAAGKVRGSQVKILWEFFMAHKTADFPVFLTMFQKHVVEHNTQRAEKIAAEKGAHAEVLSAGEFVGASLSPELEAALVSNHAAGDSDVEVKEVELYSPDHPVWLKNPNVMTCNIRNVGPNSNTIILTGIPDHVRRIVENALTAEFSSLPEQAKRLPRNELLGCAAMQALERKVRTDKKYNRIRLNFVIDQEELKNNPAFGITCEGKYYSAVELYDIIDKWGAVESFVVRNEKGEVISYSEGRLSPEVHRTIWEIQGGQCIMPYCGKFNGLDSHHLIEFQAGGETSVANTRPVCRHDHMSITNNPGRFFLIDDLCTAVWKEPGTERLKIDVCYAPASTLLGALGKKYGLNPRKREEFKVLREHLIADSRKYLAVNRPDLFTKRKT